MSFRPTNRIVLAAVLALGAQQASAQFVNGSFETGDFTGWVTQDLEMPFMEMEVVGAGVNNGFVALETEPTDREFCAVTGFDGEEPGTIFLAQDLTVPAGRSMLQFDYAAGWDLDTFADPLEDRSFSVVVEPSGGGTALHATLIRTAVAGTIVEDTGLLSAMLDLSDFAGQEVRVKFEWIVPEAATGPAICQLDNVRLSGKKPVASEAASLKVKLDFINSDMDTLAFGMVVPVSEEFELLESDIDVAVGDASFSFTLDAKGNASEEGYKLTVRPAGAGFVKVALNVVHGDLLGDLSDFGLDNTETQPGGVFCAVPVSVDLDGTLTSRSVPVLYKAVEDVKGSGAGKTASDVRPGQFYARLDFATPDMDKLSLKASGLVEPGFSPDGATASVTLGELTREFTLDASGKGESEDSTLVIKRDAKNPALYAVTFACPMGDLAGDLESLGMDNDTVAKPGIELPVLLTVTLEGRVLERFVTLRWVATEDHFGIANAKF